MIFFNLFGLLSKPKEIVQSFLGYKIALGSVIIWLAIIFVLNKLIILIAKFIGKSKLIKTSGTTNNTPSRSSSSRSFMFRDKLNGSLNKWQIICGVPQISNIRGNPNPPSLLLEENPQDRRDSFVLAKNVSLSTGNIACDVYLERDAVFNIAFRVNSSASDFYMARVDSRPGGSNGILISRNNNWDYISVPKKYVLPDQWHHLELKFTNSRIDFKINNDTATERTKNVFPITQGSIGMFNEVKRVFVNNFKVYRAF